MAAIAGPEAWREWRERAESADILATAQSFGARLRKNGTAEYEGPCPLCGGDDRFSVNIKKQVCNCRGCGMAGSVIDFVMTMISGSYNDACERINGTPRPDRTRDETLEEKRAREDRYAKRILDHERRQEEQRQIEAAKAKRDEEAIAAVLDRAIPIDKSDKAMAYLQGRMLSPHPRLIGDLKFVSDLDYWGPRDNGTRTIVRLATLPAVVAIIRDFAGAAIGISQTYLDPSEPRKWRPEGAPSNSAKKIRGEKKHGMIRLGRLGDTIAIGEGWENCLAWHQLGGGPEDVTLVAAVDLGNLAGGSTGPWVHPVLKDADGKQIRIKNGQPDPQLPGIVLPEGIKSIIILADLDSESYATIAQLRTAGNRFRAMGIHVDIAWPDAGKDFNDMLMRSA